MKKLIIIFMSILLLITITGCSIQDNSAGTVSKSQAEKNTIVIGTTSYFVDIVEFASKEFEKTSDYKLEIKLFDDIVQPNVALAEGSIDCNFYQHQPYLKAYNENRDGNLVAYSDNGISCTFGIYSERITDLDQLKKGDKVGIPSDPSNRTRALKTLEYHGLIELKDGVEFPGKADIINNYKGLDIIEMGRSNSVVASLIDLDAGATYGVHMLLADKDPTSAIVWDSKESLKKFADILVVREEDKGTKWAKKLEEALTSDSTAEFMREQFPGAYVRVN
ncbi:D-methionine transport system substrate-binding protein [Halanaerobium saccharolyticum]|uniref:D-methionine transport system substrate-binding protein n=1 Tax=Halanaerobium saccharolyticum TaxID=43595 RepID=A0A4R6LTH3_9FIRM|nr:MetQ/NlpA family ABC transporter substrate-binding protein [Halanaerobium saccharolyticum]TDO90113.1 D-methionine transport system substrate-binding protein [Halanaerobium saccharolyticum]